MSSNEGMEVSPEAEHEASLALSAEEMRRLGYAAVDRIVERLEGLDAGAAWKGAPRRDLAPKWAGSAPEEGVGIEAAMEQAVRDILPMAARVDHPRFFAFVPSAPTWAAVMADLLASGFNTFQGTWLGSGGPSTIEWIVLDWFREWLGFPEGASGLFTSGGSAANLDAIIAALEDAGRPEKASVFFGDQGHSALLRAGRIAGVPRDGVHIVPSGPDYRTDVRALKQAVAAARDAGRTPVLVGVNGGATNTGVVDNLPEIAAFCRDEGLWMHVDAAYGGFAALTEDGREALAGIELADSVALDPHKWLFQTFECGCVLLRDPSKLERAFSVNPEYLQDTKLGSEQINFGDRGLQLSRSFRALKVWMTVQGFGLGRMRRAVQHGIDLARKAEAHIRAASELEVMSPAALGVVCYRFNPADRSLDAQALEALNAEIQERLIRSELAMVSSTRLHGIYSLRLCILNHTTRWYDVERTLDAVASLGREVLGE